VPHDVHDELQGQARERRFWLAQVSPQHQCSLPLNACYHVNTCVCVRVRCVRYAYTEIASHEVAVLVVGLHCCAQNTE
jgi:hypothetical protein